MAYYNVCPDCGCSLDPGEKCDCKNEEAQRQDYFSRHLVMEPQARQLTLVFDMKEAST